MQHISVCITLTDTLLGKCFKCCQRTVSPSQKGFSNVSRVWVPEAALLEAEKERLSSLVMELEGSRISPIGNWNLQNLEVVSSFSTCQAEVVAWVQKRRQSTRASMYEPVFGIPIGKTLHLLPTWSCPGTTVDRVCQDPMTAHSCACPLIPFDPNHMHNHVHREIRTHCWRDGGLKDWIMIACSSEIRPPRPEQTMAKGSCTFLQIWSLPEAAVPQFLLVTCPQGATLDKQSSGKVLWSDTAVRPDVPKDLSC